MSPAPRQSSQERREAILLASMELFARHGLHGVTTRMVADAAGISEALLYRHFAGKEELYDEIQRICLRDTESAAGRLVAGGPSTAVLVRAVYYTVDRIAGAAACVGRNGVLKRILLGSLVGDGHFARGFMKLTFTPYLEFLTACLDAAHRAGDLVAPPRHSTARLWFCQHLPAMVASMQMPEPPAVELQLPPGALVQEVALFALRGLGLSPAALDRHFDGPALARFTEQLHNPEAPAAPPPQGDRS